MQSAPRDKLSAFELIYGRPIPQAREKGYLNPLEMEQLKYALQVGETMKALTEYGNQVHVASTYLALHPLAMRQGDPKNLEKYQPAISAHS